MSTQIAPAAPYALAAGEGKVMKWFGSTIWMKASAEDLGITEVLMREGEEPPMHSHQNEDEWLYLLEGEATFHVGGRSYPSKAGGFVSFPRGVAHTFTVESGAARILVINTPGGFERMFEHQPQSKEAAIAALEDFGMEVAGPNPGKGVRLN